MRPNRYHHLKHPRGFDDDHFAAFRSGCEVWRDEAESREVLQRQAIQRRESSSGRCSLAKLEEQQAEE